MRKRWMYIAPIALLGILVVTALGGLIVQQLWNWLLPSLFGWKQVTFWQAIGLLALCRILFGGFGRGGRFVPRGRMRERWDQMTPEERERFREGMRGRCGFGKATADANPTAGG
jgi:hypothetical protein